MHCVSRAPGRRECPRHWWPRCGRALGVPVVVRYTSTETSLGTGTRPEDADDVVATTVGRPVAGVSLRLTDEDGADVAPGTVGRVRLRSGAAMRGYWADAAGRDPRDVIDAEATAAVVDELGYVVTGDYGVLREDGNLRLAGRVNEMYIRGGYNVYPAEVEEVLAGHRGLQRVAVVGAPDPVLGRWEWRSSSPDRARAPSPGWPNCAACAPAASPTTRRPTRWWCSSPCPSRP